MNFQVKVQFFTPVSFNQLIRNVWIKYEDLYYLKCICNMNHLCANVVEGQEKRIYFDIRLSCFSASFCLTKEKQHTFFIVVFFPLIYFHSQRLWLFSGVFSSALMSSATFFVASHKAHWCVKLILFECLLLYFNHLEC